MNTLERALIEKVGRENGWENVIESYDPIVVLASARHQAQLSVTPSTTASSFLLQISSDLIHQELIRSLNITVQEGSRIIVPNIDQLARLLHRTAELAQSLQKLAIQTYADRVKEALERTLPNNTEVERLVKQRVGQDIFREALLDYWAGACAVTRIDLPEVLRASHAKPWADCDSDEERLDVFNGFLLSANLDALFDRGLISFDVTGKMIFSPKLSPPHLSNLQLEDGLSLRWLTPEHEPYLAWHRLKIFQM
ncbi:HNH endonuclease [Pelotalea chapellei]|uniref:HNH endonuclease n=1 Tax=Pelotalea chapellei TaxID=44671 RepID=A0ABS5U4U9_9BACT|nr:HNH endonuclease [Pelotalea chapellei]MBT1070701.1 HNH endonuclease [Pelotalea chapellei]